MGWLSLATRILPKVWRAGSKATSTLWHGGSTVRTQRRLPQLVSQPLQDGECLTIQRKALAQQSARLFGEQLTKVVTLPMMPSMALRERTPSSRSRTLPATSLTACRKRYLKPGTSLAPWEIRYKGLAHLWAIS